MVFANSKIDKHKHFHWHFAVRIGHHTRGANLKIEVCGDWSNDFLIFFSKWGWGCFQGLTATFLERESKKKKDDSRTRNDPHTAEEYFGKRVPYNLGMVRSPSTLYPWPNLCPDWAIFRNVFPANLSPLQSVCDRNQRWKKWRPKRSPASFVCFPQPFYPFPRWFQPYAHRSGDTFAGNNSKNSSVWA